MDDAFESTLAGIAAALVALPMAVVVATRWGSDYFPVQDMAVIDLRLRDILSADIPLVGVYSQFGWNHPGPAVYLLLKPFVVLTGGAAWGLIIGSAVIHGAALSTTVLVAKRSAGPRWALAWAVVCALSYVPMGPDLLLEAWNPNLAVPLFLLFTMLSWRFLCHPGSYAIWIAVLATLLVQLHIGYVPLVGAVAAALVWTYIREHRRDAHSPTVSVPLWGLIATLGALWLLPIVEMLVNRGGNVLALFRYFVLDTGSEHRAGPAVASRLVASEFRVPPPWMGGSADIDRFSALTDGASSLWSIVPVLLLLSGILLYRRCELPVRRLLVLSWTLIGSGFVALTLLRGKVAPYLFYWRTPLAILLVLGVAAAGWTVIAPRLRRDPWRPLGIAAITVVAVATVSHAVGVASAPGAVAVFEPIARDLSKQIHYLPGPVILRFAGSPFSGLQGGVLNELDRRNLPVGVDRGFGYQFGDHREIDVSEAARIWYASEQGFVTAFLERMPGAKVVTGITPLSAAEDEELSDLQTRAIDELLAAGRPDVIEKLDSSLAVFDLERLDVLNRADRRRFVDLSKKVERSGIYRAALISFLPQEAPTSADLAFLRPQ